MPHSMGLGLHYLKYVMEMKSQCFMLHESYQGRKKLQPYEKDYSSKIWSEKFHVYLFGMNPLNWPQASAEPP